MADESVMSQVDKLAQEEHELFDRESRGQRLTPTGAAPAHSGLAGPVLESAPAAGTT
jgi:hypothetical protein